MRVLQQHRWLGQRLPIQTKAASSHRATWSKLGRYHERRSSRQSLGPLPFVNYINDIPAVVNHLVLLIADDSKLIAPIRCPTDLISLKNDLDAFEEWSSKRHMLSNVDKCEIMEFRRSGKCFYANADFFMIIIKLFIWVL